MSGWRGRSCWCARTGVARRIGRTPRNVTRAIMRCVVQPPDGRAPLLDRSPCMAPIPRRVLADKSLIVEVSAADAARHPFVHARVHGRECERAARVRSAVSVSCARCVWTISISTVWSCTSATASLVVMPMMVSGHPTVITATRQISFPSENDAAIRACRQHFPSACTP